MAEPGRWRQQRPNLRPFTIIVSWLVQAIAIVVAALVLIGLKLGAGLASGSLGLVSEAIHSGTDLVAALLTFFALGVAARPADPGHQYGHGKAEHIAALAEATM